MAEAKSFVGRCRDFFGQKPGQTLKEFAEELRQLTPADKEDLTAQFNEAGLPVK
jgi:hypothetical protein